MVNRYLSLFATVFGAAGLLTAMAVTLEPHPSAVVSDGVRCAFDPHYRQGSLDSGNLAESTKPAEMDARIARQVGLLKVAGLSAAQWRRVEQIQDEHRFRDLELTGKILAVQASAGASPNDATPPAQLDELRRQLVRADNDAWNRMQDILDADQKLQLQFGCRDGLTRTAAVTAAGNVRI